jgi:hypothetical protein
MNIHNLYSSPNIIKMIKSRRMGWTGHVARMGKMINACELLVRKPEGRISLGRPRHRWNNIKMDLTEIEFEGVDWIHLAQDRDRWRAVVNTVMSIMVP